MEKFEQHAAEVSCAIIVLTAADKGARANEDNPAKRAAERYLRNGLTSTASSAATTSVTCSSLHRETPRHGRHRLNQLRRPWRRETELFRELRNAGLDIHP
jgi:hypothetical protein